MATGDKIFIADKPTLDEAKQLIIESKDVLDETKSKTDNIETMVNSTKSGLDSLLSTKDVSTPFTVSSLNKLYYTTQNLLGTVGTTTAVNVTQPGTLYLVYLETATNYQTTLDVIVDGTTIYRYSQNTTNTTYAGLVTSPAVLGVNSTSNFVLINNKTLPVNTLAPMNRNYSGFNVFSMKPIKFNTSLVVRGTVAGTGVGNVIVYYELD